MNEKEIRERFAPRECETQMEFQSIMEKMNSLQASYNHPYMDRDRELLSETHRLMTQKQAINIQLNMLKQERIEIEQKRKDINRVFNDLKHQLCIINPCEKFAKHEKLEDAD